MEPNPKNHHSTGRWPVIVFYLASFGYLILLVNHISMAYLDFGDGNYLYISRRLLQGVVIYKDILSPQPPLHLLLGAALLKIGDFCGNPLFLIRVFTLLLRITHAALIFLIARQLFKKDERLFDWIPSLAGIVYLFLPIGFWWSRGYQSEPLEIFWMLLSFYFFIRFDQKNMVIAGSFSSFAVLTNMTAAPYLMLSLFYLGITQRKLVLWFLLPVITCIGFSVALLQWFTSGMFLQNAIFDQVGTYPKEGTLAYMFGKIKWVGGIILSLEGPLILSSLIGLFLYFRDIQNSKFKIQNYVLFYMLATLGSFVFATKGGTVDYIFTIGEPAVALFSAYCVVKLCQRWLVLHELTSAFIIVAFSILLGTLGFSQFSLIKSLIKVLSLLCVYSVLKPNQRLFVLMVVILILLSTPGIFQDSKTLLGYNYELSSTDTSAVIDLIQKNSKPNELIFVPPYFAFLADRPLVGEFSEQFVWFIKYINWILYREGNPQTLSKLEEIGNEMASKKVKIILLNMERGRGQQTGQIEPFRKAVIENYHPIDKIPMRNETLTVFLPN